MMALKKLLMKVSRCAKIEVIDTNSMRCGITFASLEFFCMYLASPIISIAALIFTDGKLAYWVNFPGTVAKVCSFQNQVLFIDPFLWKHLIDSLPRRFALNRFLFPKTWWNHFLVFPNWASSTNNITCKTKYDDKPNDKIIVIKCLALCICGKRAQSVWMHSS